MDKQKQRVKWANTLNQTGKGLYTLVSRSLCSTAIVGLVGISTSTWAGSKKLASEGEIHLEKEHGNTVSNDRTHQLC